jgi:hypothetical protein
MKQVFRLFGNYGTVDVEIDRDLATDAILHEMNNFWANGESQLKEASGDVLLAVMKRLYSAMVYSCQATDIYSPDYMIQYFKQKDGWYPLDGSYGIKLIAIDVVFDEPECDEMLAIQPGE